MRFYLVFEQNITNIAKKTIDFFQSLTTTFLSGSNVQQFVLLQSPRTLSIFYVCVLGGRQLFFSKIGTGKQYSVHSLDLILFHLQGLSYLLVVFLIILSSSFYRLFTSTIGKLNVKMSQIQKRIWIIFRFQEEVVRVKLTLNDILATFQKLCGQMH